MRFSKSTSRGLTNTGCVCESTNPGMTTLPVQSISVIWLRCFLSQGSRRASLVQPTETILPPTQSTAPSRMIPSSLSCAERRGPVAWDRSVISWPMLTNKIAGCFDLRNLVRVMLSVAAVFANAKTNAESKHPYSNSIHWTSMLIARFVAKCSHLAIGTLTPVLFANCLASS